MDASGAWAVVVAAAVGGLTGIGGTYLQRRWEERNQATQRIHALCVQVASAALMLVFDVGWYASPAARRFLKWRTRYAVEILQGPLRDAARAIAEAKSELDLLVKDETFHGATDSLLLACQRFVELVTQEDPPEEGRTSASAEEIGKARGDFLRVASPYLEHWGRTLLGRLVRGRNLGLRMR